MAGGQSDGRPEERSGGLTGGLSGGEWWRADGAADPEGDGVYVAEPEPEPAVHRSVPSPGPAGPPAPEVPAPGPRAPVGAGAGSDRQPSFFRRRRPVEEPPAESKSPAGPPAAWPIAPAAPGPVRPPTVADFPGWDEVTIEFPPDDTVPAEPESPAGTVPAPRRSPEDGDDVAEPAGPAAPAGPGLTRSLLAGRRPSPLLLLAAGVLVGGAVSGVILVMLAGWGLAYLSARMGDLVKKFAVLGIPLITMSASSLWFWGRTEGRWGDPLAKGAPMTHAALQAAPGVLRLAAVLSALFLLGVTMRRPAKPGKKR
ncbi:hypothetical protein ACIGXM_30895 [Kitasatospora sp. NPDC052896]|uniref:hypothetical protein n=1 Tax=Kitasatospora sp. NPDC052896 TaxID=3364061 RepID=UPI0037CB2C5B